MESNAQWDPESTELVRKALSDPKRYVAFTVQDDNLYPEIRKGDLVVVDKEEKLVDSGVFALDTGEYGIRLYRLQRKVLGGVKLITDYPEKDVTDFDEDPVIVGRVVMLFRNLVGVKL